MTPTLKKKAQERAESVRAFSERAKKLRPVMTKNPDWDGSPLLSDRLTYEIAQFADPDAVIVDESGGTGGKQEREEGRNGRKGGTGGRQEREEGRNLRRGRREEKKEGRRRRLHVLEYGTVGDDCFFRGRRYFEGGGTDFSGEETSLTISFRWEEDQFSRGGDTL